MFRFITERIGVKVALIVNLCLLVVIGGGGYFIIGQQTKNLEELMLDRAKMMSMLGAKTLGTVLDESIDNGVLTVGDAMDREYVKIPGIEPAKYHTKYDAYLDKAILSFIDEYIKDESVKYAVPADINGYVPTHNSIYQKPITGDPQKDLTGNRTKRVFNDPVGIAAAKNNVPGFRQVYKRDTGETMWDVSSPIFVKGQQWGGFRIGMSIVKITEYQTALIKSLVTVMAVILVLSIILIFVVVNRALKKLGVLTEIASKLADGEVDQNIMVQSNDEIGRLAGVLERLRISLKSAIERLSKR